MNINFFQSEQVEIAKGPGSVVLNTHEALSLLDWLEDHRVELQQKEQQRLETGSTQWEECPHHCGSCTSMIYWEKHRTPQPGETSFSYRCLTCGCWRVSYLGPPDMRWRARVQRFMRQLRWLFTGEIKV